MESISETPRSESALQAEASVPNHQASMASPSQQQQQLQEQKPAAPHWPRKPAEPKARKTHVLAYGYVRYQSVDDTLQETQSQATESTASDAAATATDTAPLPEQNGKKKARPSFHFCSFKEGVKPIILYGNQVMHLANELPNAYKAFHQCDVNYRYVVAESKTLRVVLEVSLYKEKTYLFLKKYFKFRNLYPPGAHPDGVEEGELSWSPTRSVVSFDPCEDDPGKLLDYVYYCTQ